MNVYFAPMEGITGYVYRNAHHQYFNHVDRYFTPFITPNQTKKLTSRELNDVLPENNRGLSVVPQILTNKAEDFIWAAGKLKELGYGEINLNLGCPSGTVVSKNRGSGFLAMPVALNRFLETVSRELADMDMKLSVKTRIGKDDPEEFEDLLKIFNRYPMEKLIIHPRLRTDFYKNHPNLEVFETAVKESVNPVCYNGDLFSFHDVKAFRERFPQVETVMLGRGALTNPALPALLAACGTDVPGKAAGQAYVQEKAAGQAGIPDKLRLKAFHDAVLEGYRQVIPGDKNVMFKMKELWFYWGDAFSDCKKPLKKIKKSQSMEEYRTEVDCLFAACALAEPPVFGGK